MIARDQIKRDYEAVADALGAMEAAIKDGHDTQWTDEIERKQEAAFTALARLHEWARGRYPRIPAAPAEAR